jgi:hypothetical protein
MGKRKYITEVTRGQSKLCNALHPRPVILHHFHMAVSLKGGFQFCVSLNLYAVSAVIMTTGDTILPCNLHRGTAMWQFAAVTLTDKTKKCVRF